MNFIESFDEITKRCPEIQNKSGIYVYTREDRGFKFAYVGQSKHIVDRLASHLCGYDSYIEFLALLVHFHQLIQILLITKADMTKEIVII